MIHLAILAQTTYFIFQEQYQYVYLFIGLSIAILFAFPNMKPIYLLFVLLVVFLLSLYQNEYGIQESFRFKKRKKKSKKSVKKGDKQSGGLVKKHMKHANKRMKKTMKSAGGEGDPLEPVKPNSNISSKEQKLLDHTFPSPPN